MTSILAPKNKISIIRGSSRTLVLTVRDSDQAVVDLTGATIYFTVKKSEKETHCLIQKISTTITEIEIPNPVDGTAKIYLTPEDTFSLAPKSYRYDVWVELSSGERHTVIPPNEFEVTASVTTFSL